MSFAVFTDSCSNLPGSLLQHFGIRVLPCSYTVDGKQIIYGGDIEAFDAHTYYELLRQGKRVTTSLLNTQVFLDHFRPALEQGLDVVYVGLSAGISGTYQAACIAAAELRDEFPERTV
ncbi:MAG: DegV family protein, partial [Oscillospiraceae bacterium]